MARVSIPTVSTISKAGSTKLTGNVTLTGGTNVTLTQSGHDISIAAASGIGGSTGSTDNRILRADGTGGATLQNSGATINDAGGIEATTNSGATAPIKITQSDGTQEAPVIDINGADGVNVGFTATPLTGPNTNGLIACGYVKININGEYSHDFGDGDRYLYFPFYFEDCFTGDTLVLTPSGLRRIDSLKVGDEVISLNQDINEQRINIVKEFDAHPKAQGYVVLNDKLKVSKGHRLWVNDKWIQVRDILIGDYLRNSRNEKIWVYSLEYISEPCTTYNLIMDNQKMANYFASDLLVHNKCPFLYHYDEGAEYPWKCQGTFITGFDSAEKKSTSLTKLKNFSSKYYIRELEPETSHIEELELMAITPTGSVSLRRIDAGASSLVLRQGDISPVEFEPIPEGTTDLYLEATGYYKAVING